MSQRIVPFIGDEDAAGAVEWLQRAFGFTEIPEARPMEDGTITHAELDLDGATIYLSTPRGNARPRRIRETPDLDRRAYDSPWVIDGHAVRVRDVEAHHAQAVARGATILRELQEPAHGYRIDAADDREDHRWMFGERLGGGE